MENGDIEDEFQTRSRIVSNQLKHRDNCIVLKIDTHMTKASEMNPLGFHFELDKKKYEQRKKILRREKITQWFSWIAYYHHKFGIRHILLILLLVLYVLGGGAIFQSLEHPKEVEDLKETLLEMSAIMGEETLVIVNITQQYNGTVRDERITRTLKKYYKRLLEVEGKFYGSAWHKAEDLNMHLTWYYSSAAFYCMTLFTTIGYGTIACQTSAGQIISIIYACIGIPLMLVVLGDVGEWLQKILTKAYIFCFLKYKSLRKQPIDEDLEDIYLPMWLALGLVGIYISLTATFITLFDKNEGKLPGMQFGPAVYFTFISLTTIGLGDVMPYNVQYSPVLLLVFLLGLALISIVNTSIYAQLYDVFFKFMLNMEDQLERIHKEHHQQPGHKIFEDLEPTIRMLVCSFPHLSNRIRDGALEGILKPAGNAEKDKSGKKVTYSQVVRKRTISYSGDQDESKPKVSGRMRAPTLGAMGGLDLARFRREARDKNERKSRGMSDAQKPSSDIKVKRRGSDAAAAIDVIPAMALKNLLAIPQFRKPIDKNEEKKSAADLDDLYASGPSTIVAPTTTTTIVDETITLPEEPQPTTSEVNLIDFEVEDPPAEEEASPSRSSTSSGEGDDEPPEGRPAPLIELPVFNIEKGSDQEDSDEDEEEDDMTWANSKFANLNKRSSVFVPRREDSSDEDGPGPSVEYIP